MIETAFVDLPQYSAYHSSVLPIVEYHKGHINSIPTDSEIIKLLPYARQTEFILKTFREIIDDLNYNKEKFETIIFTLDDDYDLLKEFVSKLNNNFKSHKELLDLSDKIFTHLIQVQNDLGIRISQNENS